MVRKILFKKPVTMCQILLFYTEVVQDRKLCQYLIIHVNSVAYFAVYVVNKQNKNWRNYHINLADANQDLNLDGRNRFYTKSLKII